MITRSPQEEIVYVTNLKCTCAFFPEYCPWHGDVFEKKIWGPKECPRDKP